MGQRSQIYVRYNGKLLFARYFQWNFGTRMISRARAGMEYLENHMDVPSLFNDPYYIRKFIRIFETNFDYRDVAISTNIFAEYNDFYPLEGEHEFCDFVFRKQHNNDGRLLVDIRDGKIKYAFLDDRCDPEKPMTPEEYLQWDARTTITETWQGGCTPEEIQWTNENCAFIRDHYDLMTPEEIKAYIQTKDYFGKPQPF